MPAARLYAHPEVRADVGSTALRRRLIVYCLEQAEHDVPLHRILLPAQAKLTSRFDPELLGDVTALERQAAAFSDTGWNDMLYRAIPPEKQLCSIRAIPYYAWDNRADGTMAVWMREQPHPSDVSAT